MFNAGRDLVWMLYACVPHVLFRVLKQICVVVIIYLCRQFTVTFTGHLSNGEQGNLLSLHSMHSIIHNLFQNPGTTEQNVIVAALVHCWLLLMVWFSWCRWLLISIFMLSRHKQKCMHIKL